MPSLPCIGHFSDLGGHISKPEHPDGSSPVAKKGTFKCQHILLCDREISY